MKTNMKAALTLFSAPYALSFMSGMFGWYMDEGVFMLLGLYMLVGIIWAWYIELS